MTLLSIQIINMIFFAAVRASAHKIIIKDWERKWVIKTCDYFTYRFTLILTFKIFSLYNKVSKSISFMIIQLQIKKISLRKFLYSKEISDIENKGCQYNLSQQTVMYMLLMCSKFNQLRIKIWERVILREDNLKILLNSSDLIVKAANFM